MIGVEEAEICNRDGCAGIMEYIREYDCRCHISPPCFACTDAPLTCSICFEKIYRQDD